TEALIGVRSVFVVRWTQGTQIRRSVRLNASDAAIGIILAAEERPVLVLATQRIGPNVFLAPQQRVAGSVRDVGQPQARLKGVDDQETAGLHEFGESRNNRAIHAGGEVIDAGNRPLTGVVVTDSAPGRLETAD